MRFDIRLRDMGEIEVIRERGAVFRSVEIVLPRCSFMAREKYGA